MIKKIERPNWMNAAYNTASTAHERHRWFNEFIKPLNAAIETSEKTECGNTSRKGIIIWEPIVETPADVLRRILKEAEESGDYVLIPKDFEDAKKALKNEASK